VNIALFGGTGQVGSRVLTLLLERGDDVVALSLHPEKLPPVEHLKAILGDARDLTAVREAVRGADAVASCLGMANFSTPATDLSDSFKTILEAMAMEGVRRLVFIGSSGLLDHPDGGLRRDHNLPEYLQFVSAEQVRMYDAIRASDLDWTMLCPVTFTSEDRPTERLVVVEDLAPSDVSHTRDIASLLVEELGSDAHFGLRLGIGSRFL